MPIAIHYHFRQNLNVPARKAYQWCLDYQPGSGDHALMGEPDADRKVSRLSDRTIILTDTFKVDARRVEKQKLVQMYPDMLFWTSTHLTGPARHSQFLYQITADGQDASHLDFTGLFLDYNHEKMSKADAQKLSNKLCKEDADGWKLLAKAMEEDLGASNQ
jgi:hypothetical protein